MLLDLDRVHVDSLTYDKLHHQSHQSFDFDSAIASSKRRPLAGLRKR